MSASMDIRPAVFLDRDGVLNRPVVVDGKPFPPSRPEELSLLPGAAAACDDLHRRGFLVIVVTNQPDIARGRQSAAVVEAINEQLTELVEVDAVFVCPHDDGDGCGCRKPAPGLLTAAAEMYGIDLTRSFMIGDRWRDVEAGRRAGCRSILIDYAYNERPAQGADAVVKSLEDAVAWIRSRPAIDRRESVV